MPSTISWIGTTTDVSNTANYSTGSLPVTGDTLFIEANPNGTDVALATNLGTLSAVTLAALNISQTFSAAVGTPLAYFQVSATLVNIGYQYGGTIAANGSPLIRVDLGSVQSLINVTGSSSSSTLVGSGPISLKGTNASNVLNIETGSVSVASSPTEVSTIATINNGGTLVLGSGCTLTAINQFGGSLVFQSAVTTLTQSAGNSQSAGTGAITTANIYGGTYTSTSTGTITTLNVQAATADFSTDPRAKTITTANIFNGATFNVNTGVKGSVTLTNPIVVKASTGQYKLIVCPNTNIALS